MRIPVVLFPLSTVILVVGASMVFPLLWALYYLDGDAVGLAVAASLTVAAGGVLRRLSAPSFQGDLTAREAFGVASLSWLAVAAFGALPFLFTGVLSSPVDAFFESMSGFTTTGATVLSGLGDVPRGLLFWRSLTHWLGGMGIILLFVAVLPSVAGGAGMALFRAEVPGPSVDRLLPRVSQTARTLWMLYAGISLLQVCLLVLVGLPLYDALTHTFATLATGGFSTKDASIAAYGNLAAEVIVIFFMVVAGGNFALYYRLLKGNPRALTRDPEFRFYLGILATATALVAWSTHAEVHSTVGTALRQSAFQVTSMMTTTGFTTADFAHWPSFTHLLFLVLMFFGGCAGSTGGGMKQVRIMVLLKHAWRELARHVSARSVVPLRVGKQVVPEETVSSIMAFFVLAMVIYVAGVAILAAAGLDLITAIAAAAATLWNIGPGLGLVGPAHTYAGLPHHVKLVLTALMLLGRLEIMTVLALAAPRGRRWLG